MPIASQSCNALSATQAVRIFAALLLDGGEQFAALASSLVDEQSIACMGCNGQPSQRVSSSRTNPGPSIDLRITFLEYIQIRTSLKLPSTNSKWSGR
jgi:hypothetical protein